MNNSVTSEKCINTGEQFYNSVTAEKCINTGEQSYAEFRNVLIQVNSFTLSSEMNYPI